MSAEEAFAALDRMLVEGSVQSVVFTRSPDNTHVQCDLVSPLGEIGSYSRAETAQDALVKAICHRVKRKLSTGLYPDDILQPGDFDLGGKDSYF